jgi:DNA-binding IclR family transcriptional regulator
LLEATTAVRTRQVERDEFTVGVRAVAAPVRSRGGETVAALAAVAPTKRFGVEDDIAEVVRVAAGPLSRSLGSTGGGADAASHLNTEET